MTRDLVDLFLIDTSGIDEEVFLDSESQMDVETLSCSCSLDPLKSHLPPCC